MWKEGERMYRSLTIQCAECLIEIAFFSIWYQGIEKNAMLKNQLYYTTKKKIFK